MPLSRTCPVCGKQVHIKMVKCACGHGLRRKKTLNLPRESRKSYAAQLRANETDEQKRQRKHSDKRRQAEKRATETEDEASKRRAVNRKYQALKRAMETEEQTQRRREANRKYQARKRATETEEQASRRREANRKSQARKRSLQKKGEYVPARPIPVSKTDPPYKIERRTRKQAIPKGNLSASTKRPRVNPVSTSPINVESSESRSDLNTSPNCLRKYAVVEITKVGGPSPSYNTRNKCRSASPTQKNMGELSRVTTNNKLIRNTLGLRVKRHSEKLRGAKNPGSLGGSNNEVSTQSIENEVTATTLRGRVTTVCSPLYDTNAESNFDILVQRSNEWKYNIAFMINKRRINSNLTPSATPTPTGSTAKVLLDTQTPAKGLNTSQSSHNSSPKTPSTSSPNLTTLCTAKSTLSKHSTIITTPFSSDQLSPPLSSPQHVTVATKESVQVSTVSSTTGKELVTPLDKASKKDHVHQDIKNKSKILARQKALLQIQVPSRRAFKKQLERKILAAPYPKASRQVWPIIPVHDPSFVTNFGLEGVVEHFQSKTEPQTRPIPTEKPACKQCECDFASTWQLRKGKSNQVLLCEACDSKNLRALRRHKFSNQLKELLESVQKEEEQFNQESEETRRQVIELEKQSLKHKQRPLSKPQTSIATAKVISRTSKLPSKTTSSSYANRLCPSAQ